jgi:hypothetical protein
MAGRYKIQIDQGSTWSLQLTWLDADGAAVDLTGYTARMQIRPTLESTTVTASLTTENGGIALGGTAGTIDLTLSASATAAIVAGSYFYDVELVNGVVVTRVIEGGLTVRREVTR